MSIFTKDITDLPQVGPDYNYLYADGTLGSRFIGVKSEGKTGFTGFDISYETKSIFCSGVSFSGFYSYCKADKTVESIVVPYELNATNTYFSKLDYKINNIVTIGSDLTVRSGYPYTPNYSVNT